MPRTSGQAIPETAMTDATTQQHDAHADHLHDEAHDPAASLHDDHADHGRDGHVHATHDDHEHEHEHHDATTGPDGATSTAGLGPRG